MPKLGITIWDTQLALALYLDSATYRTIGERVGVAATLAGAAGPKLSWTSATSASLSTNPSIRE
jgi:hypothetical protein